MSARRIFPTPNHHYLRDSSNEEEEQDELQQQSNIEMNNLTDTSSGSIMYNTVNTVVTPILSSILSTNQVTWSTYVPSTLQLNSARYSILPAFPTSIYDDQSPPLLLANVPCKFSI